jgi:hypothetical protein
VVRAAKSPPKSEAKRLKSATTPLARDRLAASSAALDDIQTSGHDKLARAGIEVTDSGYR